MKNNGMNRYLMQCISFLAGGSKGNYSSCYGYKIVKKLGEGAFGVTYLVTKDSRDYALKKLKMINVGILLIHSLIHINV